MAPVSPMHLYPLYPEPRASSVVVKTRACYLSERDNSDEHTGDHTLTRLHPDQSNASLSMRRVPVSFTPLAVLPIIEYFRSFGLDTQVIVSSTSALFQEICTSNMRLELNVPTSEELTGGATATFAGAVEVHVTFPFSEK